jgi:5-deoxy-D-glucuronate isomerase
MENVSKAFAEHQEIVDGYAAIAVVDAEKPEQQERQRQEQRSKASEARATQRNNQREEATITALLTGDRIKAANLYVQSVELYADEFNKDWSGKPSKPWHEYNTFPAWWPDSADGGKSLFRP